MIEIAEIQAAARDLAAASAKADAAKEAGEAQCAHVRVLGSRIEALTGERASIVARRAEGRTEDGDGARLALIAADLEGLDALIKRANAKLVPHNGAVAAAQAQVSAAEYELWRLEAEHREERLLAHVVALQAAFLDAIPKLDAARKALGGGRPRWAPAPALLDGLRRLDLQAGWPR